MSDRIRIEAAYLDVKASQLQQLCELLEGYADNAAALAGRVSDSWPENLSVQSFGRGRGTQKLRSELRYVSSMLRGSARKFARLGNGLRQVAANFHNSDNRIALINDSEALRKTLDEIREGALKILIHQISNVIPPEEHPGRRAARELEEDDWYQLLQSIQDMLNLNFTDSDNLSGDEQRYHFSKLLENGETAEKKKPDANSLSDTISDILEKGGEVASTVMDILKDVLKVAIPDGAGELVGFLGTLSAERVEYLATVVNQIHAATHLDTDAARTQAELYANSDDPQMKAAGQEMLDFLDAGVLGRLKVISDHARIEWGQESVEAVGSTGLMVALAQAGPLVAGTAQVTMLVTDMAMNTGDIRELTNRLSYAADAVDATYEAYQDAYSAYETNPTQESLESMVDAYKSYQKASAESMEALADLAQSQTDSPYGRLVSDETRQSVDERARQIADDYRRTCDQIDQSYDRYRYPATQL